MSHHRLYDCRHTAASFLLAQGVAPRVVMEVLGPLVLFAHNGHLHTRDAGFVARRGRRDGPRSDKFPTRADG